MPRARHARSVTWHFCGFWVVCTELAPRLSTGLALWSQQEGAMVWRVVWSDGCHITVCKPKRRGSLSSLWWSRNREQMQVFFFFLLSQSLSTPVPCRAQSVGVSCTPKVLPMPKFPHVCLCLPTLVPLNPHLPLYQYREQARGCE
jgi:hypothetical protein